jgi:Cu-processing system permease protein
MRGGHSPLLPVSSLSTMLNLRSDINISLSLAFRARFLPVIGWLVLVLVIVVLAAAQFSARQPATIALDMGLSVIRFSLPLMIVLLAQELLTKEFDRRYFLASLAYPRPRVMFLIGRFLAIYLLTLSALILLSTLLASLAWFVSTGYEQSTPVSLGYNYAVSIAFISIDLFVITAIATLLGIVAVTPSFVLIGTVGFLLIARSYSSIVALLRENSTIVGSAETYRDSLSLLYYLLPDLGSLDVRMISLYGTMRFLPDNWPINVFSCLSYSIFLFAVSVWLLNRKQLS